MISADKLIAFERGADLIGNAFDECDFVILKTLSRLTPNQSEQVQTFVRRL